MINRALIYTALTAALTLVFLGSVLLLEYLFHTLAGQDLPDLLTVISTLVIVALFVPVRRRVRAFIDRRFYRRNYSAAQTL